MPPHEVNGPLDSNKILVFLHIPKTAGTTLKTILLRHYRPAHVFRFYDEEHHVSLLSELKRRLKDGPRVTMILGHMGWGIHKFIDHPVEYVTVVRHPVSRVISLYQHIAGKSSHPLHAEVSRMSLDDFVRSGIDSSTCNDQVRFLSGDKLEGDLGIRRGGESDQESLSRAMHNINHEISMVGISERFDETLLLLKHLKGWRDRFYTPLNVSRRDADQPKPETLAVIRQGNHLDMQLYDAARAGLENRVARVSGDRLATELESFRKWNALVGPFIGYSSRIVHRLTIGI